LVLLAEQFTILICSTEYRIQWIRLCFLAVWDWEVSSYWTHHFHVCHGIVNYCTMHSGVNQHKMVVMSRMGSCYEYIIRYSKSTEENALSLVLRSVFYFRSYSLFIFLKID